MRLLTKQTTSYSTGQERQATSSPLEVQRTPSMHEWGCVCARIEKHIRDTNPRAQLIGSDG